MVLRPDASIFVYTRFHRSHSPIVCQLHDRCEGTTRIDLHHSRSWKLVLLPFSAPTLPSSYATNPPISPSILSFEVVLMTFFDFRSLDLILHCMPNVRQLILSIISWSPQLTPHQHMLHGDQWERLLAHRTPQLDVFNLFICIRHSRLPLSPKAVIDSFGYFAKRYDDWRITINRARSAVHSRSKRWRTSHFQIRTDLI